MKSLQYRSSLVFLLVFFGLTIAIQAQQKENQAKEEILKVDTNLVSIDVAVTSKSGGRITGNLKAEDFAIYEDGQKQKIENFSTTDVPFNVVLLIDTSGSTAGEIQLIKKAGKKFLNEMRPQDRIAIIEFNQKINVLEELTTDRNKLETAFDWLQVGTGTAYYDALQTAVDDVLKKAEGRKAIIALTDGVDSDGNATFEEILPELEKSKVTVFALELNTESITEAGMMMNCEDQKSFHFSNKQIRKYLAEYAEGADQSLYQEHCAIPKIERMQINRRLYESAKKELHEITSQTGGRVYPCQRLSEIEPAYAQIASELRTQYSIGYYPANDKHDGKWRALRIEVRAAGYVAKTKPGYRAPEN